MPIHMKYIQVMRFTPLGIGYSIVYDAVTGEEVTRGTFEQMNEYITSTGGELIETISAPITEGLEALGSLSLDFIRGLGGALIDGIDGGYDAIRNKLRGNEADVIAGFTIAALSILAGVYLYHSVKAAQDAV